MNAIAATPARLSILADIDGVHAEFSPSETTLQFGKGTIIIPRETWPDVVAVSATYDAILGGNAQHLKLGASIARQTFEYPAIGTEIGGGFCGGRHPEIDGAVLITAGIDGETKGAWSKAIDHCADYRAGGHDDWRALTRLEKLTLWLRLGAPHTQVEAFKKGGKHAFADAAYWTGDQYEFDSACAWGQHFGTGLSGYWGKGNDLHVRPGRIHFIQP